MEYLLETALLWHIRQLVTSFPLQLFDGADTFHTLKTFFFLNLFLLFLLLYYPFKLKHFIFVTNYRAAAAFNRDSWIKIVSAGPIWGSAHCCRVDFKAEH